MRDDKAPDDGQLQHGCQESQIVGGHHGVEGDAEDVDDGVARAAADGIHHLDAVGVVGRY